MKLKALQEAFQLTGSSPKEIAQLVGLSEGRFYTLLSSGEADLNVANLLKIVFVLAELLDEDKSILLRKILHEDLKKMDEAYYAGKV